MVPPPSEQAAIVRFLAWAKGRMDKAIRAKRKVIALFNEQKQAIIHRAVTRGIDPDVRLKDSGIPWLGVIPEHWGIVPLKGLGRIQSGITLGKHYVGQSLSEYPYLRVANVQTGRLDLSVVETVHLPAVEAKRSMLKFVDVLMTEGGDADKLGMRLGGSGESPCSPESQLCVANKHEQVALTKSLDVADLKILPDLLPTYLQADNRPGIDQ